LRLSPRYSHWGLWFARHSSPPSSCLQIFSLAAWAQQSAPPPYPRPLRAQDSWLRGLLPLCWWRVRRVAGLRWDVTCGSQNVRRAEPDLRLCLMLLRNHASQYHQQNQVKLCCRLIGHCRKCCLPEDAFLRSNSPTPTAAPGSPPQPGGSHSPYPIYRSSDHLSP
jgi:hypothetical protein